jgi:folate-binding protein YgfZ
MRTVRVNEEWNNFLAGYKGVIEAGPSVRFGDARDEVRISATETVLAPLLQRALIRVTGDDAEDFLLGQFTNDLRVLDDTHSQLSAYCTAQGRMLAIFRVLRMTDGFMLMLPDELRDSVVQRLRMYVMRSRVTLAPVDDMVVIGLSGPGSDALLLDLFGESPAIADSCISRDGMTAIHVGAKRTRFELLVPTDRLATVWSQLSQKAHAVGTAAWNWLDIQDGIPTVRTATSEAFVPQMTNLDALDGINFKKGCYPGQEIVARMHYLGRLKQRMYGAHLSVDQPPAPGDKLYAPSFGEQAAGTIVDAQLAPTGGVDLLAVIQIGAAEAGEIHLQAADGPDLSLTELPYLLPAAERE